ncbi:unnamed protein product [Boreogadus saida]
MRGHIDEWRGDSFGVSLWQQAVRQTEPALSLFTPQGIPFSPPTAVAHWLRSPRHDGAATGSSSRRKRVNTESHEVIVTLSVGRSVRSEEVSEMHRADVEKKSQWRMLIRIQDGGTWGANSVVCKQRRCKAEIQEPGHGTRWLWNAVSGDAMDVKWLSFKSHRV